MPLAPPIVEAHATAVDVVVTSAIPTPSPPFVADVMWGAVFATIEVVVPTEELATTYLESAFFRVELHVVFA